MTTCTHSLPLLHHTQLYSVQFIIMKYENSLKIIRIAFLQNVMGFFFLLFRKTDTLLDRPRFFLKQALKLTAENFQYVVVISSFIAP